MKPNLYIELFSSELNSNEYQTYLDMKVWYQTTWLKSIFNILVVVDWSYQKGLTTLFDPPKIDYRAYDLCNQGALAAYFQFYNGTFSLNGNMTAPVNFEDSRDIPLENGKDQYNLLILSDPYPKCLNSKLLWNNTNRHLEIVVLGVQQPEKDYSKFISFSKNSLNHLNYYTSSNEGISNFWGDTSVCRTYMDQTNLTEDTMLITTTTSMPQKEAEDNNKLWIIIGGSVVVLLIIGAFVLIYFKLRQSKNTDSASGWSIEDNS
uniref:Uncharacterized protein n=1 Tax=Panagrolaimus sp. PS1159 TaxID=55785 RepID=A0AC35EWN6_9BILA